MPVVVFHMFSCVYSEEQVVAYYVNVTNGLVYIASGPRQYRMESFHEMNDTRMFIFLK